MSVKVIALGLLWGNLQTRLQALGWADSHGAVW